MTKYISLFALLFCANLLGAQTGFHINDLAMDFPTPDPNEIEQVLETHVKNTSNTTTLFRWVRTTICIDTSYGNSVCIGSNCFEQTENTRTFTLAPGDSTILSMHLWRNMPGNPVATIDVKVHPDAEPNNSATVRFTYGICTSIIVEPSAYSDMQVFPNPAASFVQFDHVADATTAQVFDLAGALVHTHDLTATNRMDVSNLAAGTFLVRVSNLDGSRKRTLSFVKQ